MTGDTRFVTLEAGWILISPARPQPDRRRVDDFVEDVAERAGKLGATHELVATDEAFFDAFSRVWID